MKYKIDCSICALLFKVAWFAATITVISVSSSIRLSSSLGAQLS